MTTHDLRTACPSHGWSNAPPLLLLLLVCVVGSGTPAFCQNPSAKSGQRSARDDVSAKIVRYTERLLKQYDQDGDGRLQEAEWSEMLLERYDRDGDRRLGPDEWDQTRIARYDLNKDGSLEEKEWRRIWISQRLSRSDAGIDVYELVPAIARLGGGKPIVLKSSHLGETTKQLPLLSPTTRAGSSGAAGRPKGSSGVKTSPKPDGSVAGPAGRQGARGQTKFFVPRTRLPRGLPAWFLLRDADGDAQLTMAEFAPKPTQSQLADFDRYDWNRDGVITAEEGARGPRPTREELQQMAQQRRAEQEAAAKIAEDTAEVAVEPAVRAKKQTAEEAEAAAAKRAAAKEAAARAAALRRLRLQQKARARDFVRKPVKKPIPQNR